VICTLTGKIVRIDIATGHNNDQGFFNMTAIEDWLFENGLYLVADGGYTSDALVTPDDYRSIQWNAIQKGLRSVVEQVNSLAHNFLCTTTKFKQNPELQGMAIMCVWFLVAYNLHRFPLRASY